MYDGKKFDELEKIILERINITIRERKIKRSDLVNKMHYSAPSISKILNGNSTLTFSFVDAFISNFCNGSMHYLLTGNVYISEYYLKRMFGKADEQTQKQLLELYSMIGDILHKLHIS